MKTKKIKDQKELDELLSKHISVNCFVQMKYGLKDPKDISLTENDDYFVTDGINGSVEIIPKKKVKNSFLGTAFVKGTLYTY